MLAIAGIPVVDVPFVTVGGGIGSFVTVDYLRIYGVPTSQMRVLSNIDYPWQTYEYLTRCSQIPRSERIRSDSSSRPDNLWGFPSYALEEAWQDKKLGHLFNVSTEPIFDDYWTPRAGTVFTNLDRERQRIGYDEMLVKGKVRMVRQRAGGGYFTILTPPPGAGPDQAGRLPVPFRPSGHRLSGAEVPAGPAGVPGEVRRLPPCRQRLRAARARVRVPEDAAGHGDGPGRRHRRLPRPPAADGRPREVRAPRRRSSTLFRTYVAGAHGPHLWSRRRGGDGWAYQGFNYPKSVWGGQLKAEMRKLEGEKRARQVQADGRHQHTQAPPLAGRRCARAARRAGTATCRATVDKVEPGPHGRLISHLRSDDGRQQQFLADFIIDCTGLEADITEHRVLADLLEHGGAGRNPVGRLDVERTLRGQGHRQRRRRAVRLGHRDARRLLPRRRHLPRAADRRPGDRRRPREAAVGAGRIGAAPVHGPVAASGARDSQGGLIDGSHLFGRIQTRIFLLATVGVVVTALITPILPAGHDPGYRTTFAVLAAVAVLGDRLGADLPLPHAVPLGEGLAVAVRPAHRRPRGTAAVVLLRPSCVPGVDVVAPRARSGSTSSSSGSRSGSWPTARCGCRSSAGVSGAGGSHDPLRGTTHAR